MTATLTNEHRWSDEVLLVAAGVEKTHGIPRLDAIEVARRKVARWGGRSAPIPLPRDVVDLTLGPRPPGCRQMVLTLGDAVAWVWVRV